MTLFPMDILTAGLVLLRYKLKKRQIRMLRRFAQMMRWPNLTDTLDNMKQKDSELALDEVSSDAFAFFSGLVLPGVSLLFLYAFITDVYRN
jgi:hypothetical protein